jgi:hypothetical protein
LRGECIYPFKFDVVMGNPPYNPPKTETGSSGNSIWQQFVIKSFYLIKENGMLLFIHPPGWKKPTDEIFDPEKLDILNGEYYKYDKKSEKQSVKQIRQGQVWKILKENGIFSFIYTNDQKNKKITEYIPYFPSVDYYVFQKGLLKTVCSAKNVFLGETKFASGVRLNYELNYLPNLITSKTQHILHKVTLKEGKKPNFIRYRDKSSDFFMESSKGKYKYIYGYNRKGLALYKYSNNLSKDNNVSIKKVIMNFEGGIDCFKIQYINEKEGIGSYDKTMYSKVETDAEGKHIEKFFNSDIVKFIFLITQYASGAITQNEPLVANSITIPPEGIRDYYSFFNIEKDKKYIEDVLTHFYSGSKKVVQEKSEDSIEKSEPMEQHEEITISTVDMDSALSSSSLSSSASSSASASSSPSSVSSSTSSSSIRLQVKSKSRTPVRRKITSKKQSKKDISQTEMNSGKLFNPLTKRYIKNTPANKKKIERITLKSGGKYQKKTKKNKRDFFIF